MKQTFMDEVYEPFGRVGGELIIEDAATSYSDLYEVHTERPAYSDIVEDGFLDAWKSEFHVSLDGIRAFVVKL
jgi:hypothetical protein